MAVCIVARVCNRPLLVTQGNTVKEMDSNVPGKEPK